MEESLLLFNTYSTCLVLQVNHQLQTQIEASLLLFNTYSTCLVLQVNHQLQTQIEASLLLFSTYSTCLMLQFNFQDRLRWMKACSSFLPIPPLFCVPRRKISVPRGLFVTALQ